MYLPLLLIAK
jgi:hypothetical protein